MRLLPNEAGPAGADNTHRALTHDRVSGHRLQELYSKPLIRSLGRVSGFFVCPEHKERCSNNVRASFSVVARSSVGSRGVPCCLAPGAPCEGMAATVGALQVLGAGLGLCVGSWGAWPGRSEMNEYQTASLIAESLVRARVDLGRAVGELRAIVKDEDARDNMPGLLHSWAAFVTGQVSEEDRARLASYSVLNARQEWALQYARSRGRVVVGDMRRRWPSFSHETLQIDLRGLVERGHLVPKGERRGRIYQPVQVSQAVGTNHQVDSMPSGNEKGIPEGAVGASDDTLPNLKPLSEVREGESQEVANADPSAMLRRILRVIARNGAKWIDAGNGRKCDGCRYAGRRFTLPGGAVRYELEVVPELRSKIVALGEVLSFELGRSVAIEENEEGFFVVVGGAK